MKRIEDKLQQMYSALSRVISDDVSKIGTTTDVTNEFTTIRLHIDKDSNETQLRNEAETLTAHIASLKDHLKAWCKKNNRVFNGEKLINNNRSVAIIHDLWNVDKHAELNKDPRSGHTPELIDLCVAVRTTTVGHEGNDAAISMSPNQIWFEQTNENSQLQIVLYAKVVDEHGIKIGEYSDLCVKAIDAWEDGLIAAGVLLEKEKSPEANFSVLHLAAEITVHKPKIPAPKTSHLLRHLPF